jgi:purine nucleosidase/pyrimidine-specific ribonucleoside hydrolase
MPQVTATTEVTLTPTATAVPKFALAGQWTGVAINGDSKMDTIMEFKSACNVGEVCGYYNLMTIPCAGAYTFIGETDGMYEFTSGDFIGDCADSSDSFSLNPDGMLQYSSRGIFGETTAELSPIIPMPVIFEDDGSPDGTVALMYLLSDPRVSLKAISISFGEANPEKYIQLIAGTLDGFGISDIPFGVGSITPLGGDNSFPASIRSISDNFWGQPKPTSGKYYPTQEAARLMVDTLHSAPEPVTIFISGPCTNLAAALRLDSSIKEHIRAVFIMGGALYIRGNLTDFGPGAENSTAEWNIYSDPLAASEVFQSGLQIYLVPLDATNQVSITRTDTATWNSDGVAAKFAYNLYDQQISSMGRGSMSIWDIMTAEIMVNPNLCQFTDLSVEVDTTDGSYDGMTRVIPNGEPNIHACLQPDAKNLIHTLDSIFAGSH